MDTFSISHIILWHRWWFGTTVKENEIRSSYSWSVGATLAVTAENFTAIPAETPLEGATHLLVPWKLRLARGLGIPLTWWFICKGISHKMPVKFRFWNWLYTPWNQEFAIVRPLKNMAGSQNESFIGEPPILRGYMLVLGSVPEHAHTQNGLIFEIQIYTFEPSVCWKASNLKGALTWIYVVHHVFFHVFLCWDIVSFLFTVEDVSDLQCWFVIIGWLIGPLSYILGNL